MNHEVDVSSIVNGRHEICLAAQVVGGRGSKRLTMRIGYDASNVAFAHYFIKRNDETMFGYSDVQEAVNCYNGVKL